MWSSRTAKLMLTGLVLLLLGGNPGFLESAHAQEEGYLLRYKFQPNQLVYYSVSQTMEMTTILKETKETAKNSLNAHKHYRVISVDNNGSALLELVLDKVTMSAQFGENDPVTYDSTSSALPPKQFVAVQKTVGRPSARSQISAWGEVLSLTQLIGPIQQTSGDDSKPDASQNFLFVFPKERIKIGDTWQEIYEAEVQYSPQLKKMVKILRKFTLMEVNNQLASIKVQTTILSPLSEPYLRAQLVQKTPSGTIVFDIDKGQMVSRAITTDDVVINPFGLKSSLSAKTARTEKLESVR